MIKFESHELYVDIKKKNLIETIKGVSKRERGGVSFNFSLLEGLLVLCYFHLVCLCVFIFED